MLLRTNQEANLIFKVEKNKMSSTINAGGNYRIGYLFVCVSLLT